VPGRTSRAIYRTATTLDGYLADQDNSLTWLFEVEHDEAVGEEYAQFMEGVTVYVEGSTTYEWVLREADLLAQPEKWQGYYGDRPTFVFTTRRLPRPDGADVRFVSGPVAGVLPEIRAAAGDGDIWITGGGDLAGQFFEAGALDRIELSIAPVTLGAGAPLLPRRIDSTRLRLDRVVAQGQFISAAFDVV
jgi:dihydrofolate reductase